MNKLSIIFALNLLFFAGCKEEKVFTFTDNDLKMVDILVDVFVADAATKNISDKFTKDSLRNTYFNQIYQIHNIDSTWLNTQKVILETDPVRMDSVYFRASQKTKALSKERIIQ